MSQKPSPEEELEDLVSLARSAGQVWQINIDAEASSAVLDFVPELDLGLQARLGMLCEVVMCIEVGPDWKNGKGGTGKIRIDHEGAYLDYDDRAGDWTYERGVEDLFLAEWEPEWIIASEAPQP